MTKQEIIQQAYGKYYRVIYPHAIGSDGWVTDKFGILWQKFKDDETFEKKISSSGTNGMIRPVSLQGIENNNGWIKIESDADLPNESTFYWVQQSDGRIQTIKEYFDNKQYYDITATGYQRIEYPKKQIY